MKVWGDVGAALRQVSARMYARAIFETGDMTTAQDELLRAIIMIIYDEDVPMSVAGRWLQVTPRWLRTLASRPPRQPMAPSREKTLLGWLQCTQTPAPIEQVIQRLSAERGWSDRDAQITVRNLIKLGRVERVDGQLQLSSPLHVKPDLSQRRDAVFKLLDALPRLLIHILSGEQSREAQMGQELMALIERYTCDA